MLEELAELGRVVVDVREGADDGPLPPFTCRLELRDAGPARCSARAGR